MKKTFIFVIISGCFVALLSCYSRGFDVLTIIYKVCGLILFALSLIGGLIKDKDFFSPFTLFAATPFSILVYDEYLSSSFLPMPSAESVAHIILGQACFLVGLTISKISMKRVRIQQSASIPLRKYSWVTLFIIGISPIVLALVLQPFNIGMSAEAIEEYRTNFSLPVISTLSCLTTGAILYVARTKKIKIFLVLLVITMLSGIFTLGKGSAVILFLTVLYATIYYWDNKYRIKIIICSFLTMLALFQLYGVIRQGSLDSKTYISSYEYYTANNDIKYVTKPLQPLYSMYMYLTTPLSNFSYIVENDFESTNGLLTMWPLLSTFQLKRVFGVTPEVKPIRKWPYNTHSFLADFYLDFGTVGVLILPCLLGFIVYVVYARSLHYNDVLLHAEYLYFGFATLMMFFSNHFTSIGYPVRIFLIFESFRFLSRLSFRTLSPLPRTKWV